MKKSKFESGRQAAKILALLSVGTCLASLMAGEGTPLQLALAVLTLVLFVSIFTVAAVRCRCPHCGKMVIFGLWNATTCPRCKRSLTTGNKIKGKK